MTNREELLDAAHSIGPELVMDRRAIHQNPEMAYKEVQTAALVADRLRELGFEFETGVAQTGVVALLEGAKAGKTVLLRADMDALPLEEEADLPFTSANKGVMHACGHDGHTAMLLGAARLLAERRESLNGSVKFMFQPAEEGGAGALRMIEAGLLENPQVDAAFALHVDALTYAGQISVKSGPTHASADTFQIKILGKGGHAARPSMTVDPIVIASQVVMALQTLVSREVSPTEEAVVTVGSLQAGTTFNIIPDTAVLRGTVRTYSEDVQAHIEKRIAEMASGIARAMRGDAEVDYRRLYPPNVNHSDGAETVRVAARRLLPDGGLLEDVAAMGGEDFAFLMQRVPGAMFRLGVRRPEWDEPKSLHSASFELDEDALPVGTAVLAATALKYLNQS